MFTSIYNRKQSSDRIHTQIITALCCSASSLCR